MSKLLYKHIGLALLVLTVVHLCGCQTLQKKQRQKQTKREIEQAIGSVAEAISGKELTQEELRDLKQQIKDDPQAQAAIQTITNTMGSTEVVVKYCPLTGKRYAADLTQCPIHEIELKIVEE